MIVHRAGKRLVRIWRRSAARRRRLAPLLPLLALAGACALTAGALSSCGSEHPPIGQLSGAPGGAPDIRVRLTSHPVALAEFSTSGGYRLSVDRQLVAESDRAMPATRVSRQGGTWHFGGLTAEGKNVLLETAGDGIIRWGAAAYRGRAHLLPAGEEAFTIVNQLDAESYLAGVLSRELYPSWSLQTYRALAIAARTFALYQKYNLGTSREYDLTADQASQVYGGFSAETDLSRQAVRDTCGQVLAYGPAGKEQIFLAQYSACCGGIVNSASVMRDAEEIPPLVGGQGCDDCRACRHYRWEPVKIAKADVARAVAAAYPAAPELAGSVARIDVVKSAPYGRAVRIDLVGPNDAKVRLRAEDLRLALLRSGLPAAKKLYSMNCQIREAGDSFEFLDGRGFGHGVGLCQWGAQGKSEKGWTAEQILGFYYPGSKLFRAY